MDPRYFLVLAIILVMGWFAAGVLYNLRLGNALLRWLQGGLPQVGERTTLRWLGTSVVEMVIAKAKKPFRRLETLIILAPRDVPWLWLLTLTQGRRDTLVFRADLVNPPQVQLDLADPAHWTGKIALEQAAGRQWQAQPYQGLRLVAPTGRLGQAAAALDGLQKPLGALTTHVNRLSLRREPPHLELHIPFPDRRAEAGAFIAALQELARAAGNLPEANHLPEDQAASNAA